MSNARRSTPLATAVLSDGRLVELLFDPANEETSFLIADQEGWTVAAHVDGPDGERYVPYRANNPLLKLGVVQFPSGPMEYGSTADLVGRIRSYLHRYVDLSESFELLAAYYILFTWVFDRFNEVPYLRLQGEYGTGKTRFLLVAGAICRTPIFAAGASSNSPLFHLLDRFSGTLIIDEADFRFSDEQAQIAKILNSGNLRGFPVLRCEQVGGKEFAPRAFQVFGPKLIAMRGDFDDRALESRFITERSDGRRLRADIPLNLPTDQQAEALILRDMLLMFRLRRFADVGHVAEAVDPALDPRTNQIFAPLLSIIEEEAGREALRAAARERQRALDDERSSSPEAGVLAAILYLAGAGRPTMPLADIADFYTRANVRDLAAPATSRWVGYVVRKSFGLTTRKSHGVYVLPTPDPQKLALLHARYRIADDSLARMAEVDPHTVLTTVEPITPPDA